MSKLKIFLDSSALIAGVLSSTGAARALLVLSENGAIELYISEHVIAECERSLARKAPEALPDFRATIKAANFKILENPSPAEVQAYLYLILDPQDVPILLSALQAKVDFLATHNRKHFLDDPEVAEKTGLCIGTPGDAIAWLRKQAYPDS
jgi:predicted nucleic acid-binding protein